MALEGSHSFSVTEQGFLNRQDGIRVQTNNRSSSRRHQRREGPLSEPVWAAFLPQVLLPAFGSTGQSRASSHDHTHPFHLVAQAGQVTAALRLLSQVSAFLSAVSPQRTCCGLRLFLGCGWGERPALLRDGCEVPTGGRTALPAALPRGGTGCPGCGLTSLRGRVRTERGGDSGDFYGKGLTFVPP